MRTLSSGLAALALVAATATLAHAQRANAPEPATATRPVASTSSDGIDGEVSDMFVKGDSLEVVYRNAGRVATEIIGAVQVRSLADDPVTTVPLHAATVAPGATHRMRIAMPKLAKGRYTLYAIVDYGGAQLTAAQAALEIK